MSRLEKKRKSASCSVLINTLTHPNRKKRLDRHDQHHANGSQHLVASLPPSGQHKQWERNQPQYCPNLKTTLLLVTQSGRRYCGEDEAMKNNNAHTWFNAYQLNARRFPGAANRHAYGGAAGNIYGRCPFNPPPPPAPPSSLSCLHLHTQTHKWQQRRENQRLWHTISVGVSHWSSVRLRLLPCVILLSISPCDPYVK